MLSFEQKKEIFRSYKDLVEKSLSNERINYEYPKSQQRGKVLATQLHPNGNGYVNGKYMDPETIEKKAYKLDSRGFINIKNFSKSELHEIIQLTMNSMNQLNSPIRKKIMITSQHKPQQIVARPITDHLVRSCLSNWLGYGNLNGSIWFLETEEEGDEVWENRTKTLEESLKLRSNFAMQMDFQHALEELYRIPLEMYCKANKWNYMAAFLLGFSGEQATEKKVNDFLFQEKKLGNEEGNHFLARLRPLPKQSKTNVEPYQNIWESNESYEAEIEPERTSLIKENLMKHPNVELMITYESDLTEKLIRSFSETSKKISRWELNDEKFVLYQIKLSKERNILLLSTPFFSDDHITMTGIQDCVIRANRIKNWAL